MLSHPPLCYVPLFVSLFAPFVACFSAHQSKCVLLDCPSSFVAKAPLSKPSMKQSLKVMSQYGASSFEGLRAGLVFYRSCSMLCVPHLLVIDFLGTYVDCSCSSLI